MHAVTAALLQINFHSQSIVPCSRSNIIYCNPHTYNQPIDFSLAPDRYWHTHTLQSFGILTIAHFVYLHKIVV